MESKRNSLAIVIGDGWGAINGNDLSCKYCQTMVAEWIENGGKEIELIFTYPDPIGYKSFKLALTKGELSLKVKL